MNELGCAVAGMVCGSLLLFCLWVMGQRPSPRLNSIPEKLNFSFIPSSLVELFLCCNAKRRQASRPTHLFFSLISLFSCLILSFFLIKFVLFAFFKKNGGPAHNLLYFVLIMNWRKQTTLNRRSGSHALSFHCRAKKILK